LSTAAIGASKQPGDVVNEVIDVWQTFAHWFGVVGF